MAIENFTRRRHAGFFHSLCNIPAGGIPGFFPMNRRNLISISPNHIPERIKCIEPDGEMRKINRLLSFHSISSLPIRQGQDYRLCPMAAEIFSQISFNASWHLCSSPASKY